MRLLHLTSSRFFGGPERQMLGLARALRPDCETTFASFPEHGHCRTFLNKARNEGFEAIALENDSPALLAAVAELSDLLRRLRPAALCCHGYKADLLGLWAARRVGLPVVGVSRGWTAENWKVRGYEALDRFALRHMDRVVCVSRGQAVKVRRAGVVPEKMRVIHNAIDVNRFNRRAPDAREKLQNYFPSPRRWIIGAAGRLSQEKGIDVLVEAAAHVIASQPEAGFIVFGDGGLREKLFRQAETRGLSGRFILAGFRSDLDALFPSFDLLALPSFTEGLPNVVLEAFAAAVPVVATDVGGVPEVVDVGHNGFLVPPGDSRALADRILDLLASTVERRRMGRNGRERVRASFTFAAQAEGYRLLLDELAPAPRHRELATISG
jgi:glycosyltransferase involved in cell wall biosynthesis